MHGSAVVRRRLQLDEDLVVAVRLHFVVLVSPVATALAALLAAIATNIAQESDLIRSIVGLLAILFICRLMAAIADWYLSPFAVTSRRLILPSGPFSKRSEVARFGSLLDIKLQRSFRGRVFGYGTLVITVAGEGDLVICYVPYPEQIYNEISQHASHLNDRSDD